VVFVAPDQPPEDRQLGEQAFDEALVAALDNQDRAGAAQLAPGVVEARLRRVW
jgi:hypothetical protein